MILANDVGLDPGRLREGLPLLSSKVLEIEESSPSIAALSVCGAVLRRAFGGSLLNYDRDSIWQKRDPGRWQKLYICQLVGLKPKHLFPQPLSPQRHLSFADLRRRFSMP